MDSLYVGDILSLNMRKFLEKKERERETEREGELRKGLCYDGLSL